jgi:site-specific DNA-methyltransferase (adenine-specific)
MTNKLYFGDNLHVLREHVADESVDLVYLDPPFNSNANYNILFKSPEGADSDAQIEAFEDTWHWNDNAEKAFDDVMRSGNSDAFELLRAMRAFLGDNDMMAYLAMMAVRLIELHRVLKPTGSLYLHCDPTASHYLKLLLDGVFGADKFRSEIVWRRTSSHNSAKRWGPVHDIIFQYVKSENSTWNSVFETYDQSYVDRFYRHSDERGRFRLDNLTGAGRRTGESGMPWRGVDPAIKGRHWAAPNAAAKRMGLTNNYDGLSPHQKLDLLDANGFIHWPKTGSVPSFKRYLEVDRGPPIQDVIVDIGAISSQAQERLGYPTQKPLALLERIIAASSNEGDVVLDPFCGCGTAVHAAQKLGRQWIGIDVTHLAVGLIEKRMKDAFPGLAFEVVGRPQDLNSALDLAARDKHQFELWALSVVEAQPWKGGRKGADGGIDGIIYFKPDGKRTERAIVEVKGGGVGVKDIGRLAQVIERERAPFGVFITAQNPTRAMERDAAAVGVWENELTGRRHPRLQILTLAELFQGKRPEIPWIDASVAKQAKREDTSKQGSLL